MKILKRMADWLNAKQDLPEIPAPDGGYSDSQIDAIRIGLALPAPASVSYCDHPDCAAKTWFVAVLPSRTAPGGWTHLVLEDRHQAQPWHEARSGR